MLRLSYACLCGLAALVLSSCGHRESKQSSQTQATSLAGTKTVTAEDLGALTFFRNENASLKPVRLCHAELTSQEGMDSAFPDDIDDFFKEATPEKDAFYIPAADIRDKELVRRVQLRYNYVAMFNRVMHSYEWSQRMSTGIGEEDSFITKKDTLEWIRSVRPTGTTSLIREAFPDAWARNRASGLLKAYDLFDGNDSEDSLFDLAVYRYTEALWQCPEIVSKEETDLFEKRFWDWYDKKNVVPEINTLVRMNMFEYEGGEAFG